MANYTFPQITEVANPKALANATVEWVDSNGINFSSLGGLQPEGSYFKIISIETLPDTPAGMHPKKLSLQLSCRVYDAQQNFLDLTDVNATIVMVYK